MLQLTQSLHHAYGAAGDAATLVPEILRTLEKSMDFVARGNPDFRQETYEVMGIDEARALKEAAGRTAVTGGKKIFIVAAHGITKEAQNALLKILEEPTPDTHFFLIVPTMELLLPTLRSRLCEIRYLTKKMPVKESVLLAKFFLESAVPARLKSVRTLLKEVEEEDAGKGRILDFLDALEHAAAKDTEGNARMLSEILEAKKYSRDRAPSFKLLLEHLALVLPKM